MPARRARLPLLAGLAIAALAGGCGDDELEGTIPPEQGNPMLAQLDAIRASVDGGQCDQAQEQLATFETQVNGLPSTAGEALKEALRSGAANLSTLIDDQCEEPVTGATGFSEPPAPEPETTEEEEEPPAKEPKPDEEGNGNGGGKGRGNDGGTDAGSGGTGGSDG